MKKLIVKPFLFLTSFLFIHSAQAQEGVLNADEVTAAVRHLMDKTMSNPVAGKGGSEPSVTYSMTAQEVCNLFQSEEMSMCGLVSQHLRIEQRVYSEVKGVVSWSIGLFPVLEVAYDQNDVALTVDIGAVHDIVSVSDLSQLFGDSAEQIATFIPAQGKLKLRVQSISESHTVVKLEVLEGIDHTIDIGNSEFVKLKLAEGDFLSSDILENQLLKFGFALDDLKISFPGSINPLFNNSGPNLELTNSRFKGELSISPQTGTLSASNFWIDSFLLKIGESGESVTLHGAAPLNITALLNDGVDVQILNNNWSLAANVNTTLLPIQLQGDYKVSLSKNDAFSVGLGAASLNLNNLEIKAPTAILRDLAGLPFSQTGIQTQLLVGKIKGDLFVEDDGINGPSNVSFTGVELNNIAVKTDGVSDLSFHNSEVISLVYLSDLTTLQKSWTLSGVEDLVFEVNSNFANLLSTQPVFEADKVISLDVDQLSGQLVVKNDGNFELKNVKIGESNTTGHILLAQDSVPMFDLSQNGELNLASSGPNTFTLATAQTLGLSISTNPLMAVTGNINIVNTSGTTLTSSNGALLVSAGQMSLSADTAESAGLLSMGLGSLLGSLDPISTCAAENEVSACAISVP